jgi:hypothetical protein
VIGTTIASVQQTTGAITALLSTPTSAGARRIAGRLVKLMTRRHHDRERASSELAELVTLDIPEDDEGKASRRLRVLLFPVALAGGVYSLMRSFYSSLFVDPILRRGWRARKHLADATAVELTRNPDAVARALAKLANTADLLPGAAWASHLFVVGPEVVMAKNTTVLQQRLEGHAEGGTRLGILADVEAMSALAAMAEAADAASFHPPLYERAAALHRLGATTDSTSPLGPAPRRRSPFLAVLAAPFRLVAFVFHLVVPLFALAVALFLGGIYVVPVVVLLHEVLR